MATKKSIANHSIRLDWLIQSKPVKTKRKKTLEKNSVEFTLNNATIMDFAWSLKPIFLWFTFILGIDLDKSKRMSNLGKRLTICYGVAWVILFSIPSHVMDIIFLVLDLTITGSYVFKMNMAAVFIGKAIFGILFHLSILKAAFRKWKLLWNTLQRMQYRIGDNSIYNCLRRDAIFGLLLILTVRLFHSSRNDMIVLVLLFILLSYFLWLIFKQVALVVLIIMALQLRLMNQTTVIVRIFEGTRMILFMQILSFVVLSAILIRIPSLVLAMFAAEVQLNTSTSVTEMIELVAKWNEHYLLVRDIVAKVNDFLGEPLLLFFGFSFLTFIGYSFNIFYILWMDYDLKFLYFSDDIFITLQNFVCIVLLVFVSDKIPQQVSSWWGLVMTLELIWYFNPCSTDFKRCRSLATRQFSKQPCQKSGKYYTASWLYY